MRLVAGNGGEWRGGGWGKAVGGVSGASEQQSTYQNDQAIWFWYVQGVK